MRPKPLMHRRRTIGADELVAACAVVALLLLGLVAAAAVLTRL